MHGVNKKSLTFFKLILLLPLNSLQTVYPLMACGERKVACQGWGVLFILLVLPGISPNGNSPLFNDFKNQILSAETLDKVLAAFWGWKGLTKYLFTS